MTEHVVITFAALFATGSICQWIAWRVKLPAIVFLLAAGILAGPVLGILHPDMLLGDLFFPFVSLSVAIILFEGSLTLRFREIIGMQAVVRNMVSSGVLVTWLITAVATHIATGIPWQISFLFGAITVVTGPTVIVPMLRTVRPSAAVSNILRWEGVVIDPVGASLAVLVYEFIIAGGIGQAFSHTVLVFGQIVLIGLAVGSLGGYLFGLVLRHHWLPEFLHNVTTIALVCGSFAVSNMLQSESGLVTVTVLGIWLANMEGVDMNDILDFKESLSILLISLLFVMLAARIDFAALQSLGWPALWVFIAIQFLARPLNVMLSTFRSKLTWPERHMLAWIAPRGIVAAAISALFTIQLERAGFANAHYLVPLTFLVIIGTVLLQSTTARFIAEWLGVAEPDPKGFIIVGANIVARSIGKALVQNGLRVLLADADWDNIRKAKMEGLDTYLGNPISEHADRQLDLVGIGRMLALSVNEAMNTAAVMHYRMEFGSNNVFFLRYKPGNEVSDRIRLPARISGGILFGKDVTYSSITSIMSGGGDVRTTRLTDKFDFEAFMEKTGRQAVPLFAIDEKEIVHVFTADKALKPAPGWSVIYLMPVAE